MIKYQIEFNGFTPENFGAFLPDYPQISYPKRRYEEITIPNMNGTLITDNKEYDNIVITCNIAVLNQKLMYSIDKLKHWLRGTGVLRFSDMQDRFFEVLAVNFSGLDRLLRNYGVATVEFICYPYSFLNSGTLPLTAEEIHDNPFDICKPTYSVVGNGEFSLNVNNKTVRANITEPITIDSRRMIAYKTSDRTWLNNRLIGDYENLWLPSGKVNISITKGFDLKIVTNWGWLG